MSEQRSPIVTDADRDWALAQCPSWAIRGGRTEKGLAEPDSDDPRPAPRPVEVLVWDRFVADQIERFEKFFNGELRSYSEWSGLWRKSWWPKADARKLYPKLVPRSASGAYPVFRSGSPEFAAALKVASVTERRLWMHLGVVQFDPADPRLTKIHSMVNPAGLTELSRAMSGDAT